MPRKKVIEKKSLDPVKAEIKEEKIELEPKKYNGKVVLAFIGENDNAYHIQLDNGTTTWVPKEAIE
jgi:hypothetical protein